MVINSPNCKDEYTHFLLVRERDNECDNLIVSRFFVWKLNYPQAMVTLSDFGYPVEVQSFDTFKLFGYPVLVYPIKVIPETCHAH